MQNKALTPREVNRINPFIDGVSEVETSFNVAAGLSALRAISYTDEGASLSDNAQTGMYFILGSMEAALRYTMEKEAKS